MKIDIIIATNKPYSELTRQIEDIENNTLVAHRIICTCQDNSAAINRNYGLKVANSEIAVMMDDDVMGFKPNWLKTLVKPFYKNKNIIVLSPLIINPNGGTTMGMSHRKDDTLLFKAENERVATSCIVIRKNEILFNEFFIGSGYEDTAYCNDIKEKYGEGRIWVNAECELIHLNEMKKQGGEYWRHNHELYMKLYPWDSAARSQKDWTKT